MEHCRPLFVSLKINTVINLAYDLYILFYTKNNTQLFNTRQDFSESQHVYRSTIYIYTHRLAIISNSFKINSITCFNMHPEAAWPITINNFKTKIYIWVLEKFWHSLNTFSQTDLGNFAFKIAFNFICTYVLT